MTDRKLRVLTISSHPIQYGAPLFRLMATHPKLDFQVAYCSLRGAESAAYDPEFGANVQWDVPLLDGYKWTHIPNRGNGTESFWAWRNTGLWKFIRQGNFDAVISHISYIRATFWIAYLAARTNRHPLHLRHRRIQHRAARREQTGSSPQKNSSGPPSSASPAKS